MGHIAWSLRYRYRDFLIRKKTDYYGWTCFWTVQTGLDQYWGEWFFGFFKWGFSLNHNFRFWIWFCLSLWRWDLSSYDNWNVTLVLNLLIYRLNYCTERFHHSFTFPVKFRGSDTSIKLRKKRNSIMDQMNIKLQYHISYMTITMIIVNFVKEKLRSVIALNDREKSSDWIFIGI